MRHSFEAHSSSPNFSYTCGINGCPQTFTSFSAIKSHLGRKHRGVDLEAACTVSSGGRQNESDTVPESMDFTESQHEENSPDQSLRSVGRLEKSAALFLLSLKERYEITQSALDFAVFNTSTTNGCLRCRRCQRVRGSKPIFSSASLRHSIRSARN